MRILFTSIRTTSHFLPLVPFIEACRRAGHEVAVAAPADLAERVAATGAEFKPFGHAGDERLAPIWKRMRDAAPGEESKKVAFGELFAGILTQTALPGLLETMEQWQPAVVIRESQEYAAIVAAEKVGIPHLRVAITANNAEHLNVPYAVPAIDSHRSRLELPLDPSGERVLREPVLSLIPEVLENPELPAPAVSRFRTAPRPAPPLPDWWNGAREPFVYVTLGTVAGSMEAMRFAFGVVLEALRGLPIRVLLTIGKDLPLEMLGEVPANVHVERFVPQDDVLPHANVVLCHGGSGTVIGTLAAGVPMVVAPMFADQMNNAARVAAIGSGLSLPKSNESAPDLRRALVTVLEDHSFRETARRIAREIAAMPLVDEAPATIERLAKA